MIPFRYHLVSVTTFFLALAVGVVLGSTSLSERLLSVVSDERTALKQQATEFRQENEDLRAELAGADRFGRAVGSMAVRGKLDNRRISLVSSSAVSEHERKAMRQKLEQAGATVAGEVRMTDRITDPGEADQLRRMIVGLLPAGVQLPDTANPGTLLGGLLGPLTLLDPQTGEPQVSERERVSVVAGMTDGGFVRFTSDGEPAELAVVLTGGRVEGNDAGTTASTLARLAAELDNSGSGAVLAGRTGSAAGNGAVGVARTDPASEAGLSTVDNTDAAFGRVAVVLALAAEWERRSGHYGLAENAQGVVPGARD
ncbi:copper transporter [Parasphingorhabdus pacifica]